jgi:sulfate transport system substrate-binding protein
VQVITPNPRTSGGARWNYLAAWGYALKTWGSEEKAREFVAQLFKNVPVLDAGARTASATFVQRGIGDVLITWENEAWLSKREAGADKVEIVTPSLSILAEPPVSVVDRNVDRAGAGNRIAAQAYLEFLYTPEAQAIASRNFYRPRRQVEGGLALPEIKLFTLAELFHDWAEAHRRHFAEGGSFDLVQRAMR